MIDHEDALYKELWHACAGPLVTVPRQGQLVFYFPQGHIEQVPPFFLFQFSSRFLCVGFLGFFLFLNLIHTGFSVKRWIPDLHEFSLPKMVG